MDYELIKYIFEPTGRIARGVSISNDRFLSTLPNYTVYVHNGNVRNFAAAFDRRCGAIHIGKYVDERTSFSPWRFRLRAFVVSGPPNGRHGRNRVTILIRLLITAPWCNLG